MIGRLARRRSGWNAVTGAFLVGGALWIAASARPEMAGLDLLPNPRPGFPAPAFTLPTRDAGEFSLADAAGDVVVINLWASWCPPCRAELPTLQSIADQLQPDGLTVVGINAANQDDRAAAEELLADLGISFPIVFDEKGAASSAYQLRSLPTTYIVGRDGLIRHVVIGGPIAEATLAALIQDLLRAEG